MGSKKLDVIAKFMQNTLNQLMMRNFTVMVIVTLPAN